jgi:hypothetical protein
MLASASRYNNTIYDESANKNNYGTYIAILLVVVIILVILTVKNILTVNELQTKINNDFTFQISDLIKKNQNSNDLINGLNKLVNENTTNFNKLLNNNIVINNKLTELENKIPLKLKFIDIIKGTYSFDIKDQVKLYADIYPASEYFKKYTDNDIVKNKYEYEHKTVETKKNDGTIILNTVPIKLKDNSLTIKELKQKIKLDSYKNDPILIIISIVDNTTTDPISGKKNQTVKQYYNLISQESNHFVFDDNNNNFIHINVVNELQDHIIKFKNT